MTTPVTRYARSGGVNIAYQVVGDGPFDLLWVPGWVSNLEMSWEVPEYARFLSRLASFSRLILFDKRGTGLSDAVPIENLPDLEQRMDDVRAVLKAAGSTSAAIFGASEGGNLSVLFTATHPERVRALVLVASFAKRVWSPDYPWAPTPDEREQDQATLDREWSGDIALGKLAPSAAAFSVEPTMSVNSTVASLRSGSGPRRTPVRNTSTSSSNSTAFPSQGRWSSPGNSTYRACGIWPAIQRDSSALTSRSPRRQRSNVGAASVGNTERVSISVFIRLSATAAPGVALRRKKVAIRRMRAGSPTALGARSSSAMSPDHSRSITAWACSRCSGVAAQG